ncbi:conserved hypothetical protein [Metamycoplasma arthritidis 158L3-1]|uniref:Uncharacterized protein n=2 Tax=Metamycoplasma arthritidis TaxID=2111 RepID=B3PNI7_META1|nr:conserved hypothetical protein [Metamycoplasma arthritidis 158L3-1]
MVDVAKKVFDQEDSMEFEEIFELTKQVLFDNWRKEAPEKMTDEKLLEVKRGELYKLFTVDGHFFRNENGTWTTKRPDVIIDDRQQN